MGTVIYKIITSVAELGSELSALNMVWALILGEGSWSTTVVSKTKDKATNKPQRTVLWIKDLGILKADQKIYFNDSDAVLCFLSRSRLVVEKLNQISAANPFLIEQAFGKAESSLEKSYCLAHGESNEKTCPHQPPHC